MSAKPRPKKARRLKKSEGYVYRYHVSCCPECGQDFTTPQTLKVVLAVAGTNPEFMSQIDKHGTLDDPEKMVFHGKHCATECFSCGFDLWNYEDVLAPGESRPEVKPFPWSYDQLCKLHPMSMGDVPDMAGRAVKYIVTSIHSDLACGGENDLDEEVDHLLDKFCKEMRAWAATTQKAIEKWRDGK